MHFIDHYLCQVWVSINKRSIQYEGYILQENKRLSRIEKSHFVRVNRYTLLIVNRLSRMCSWCIKIKRLNPIFITIPSKQYDPKFVSFNRFSEVLSSDTVGLSKVH